MGEDEFLSRYLMPAYRRLIEAQRALAPRQLAFVQPRISSSGTPIAVGELGPGVVYAPHWYSILLVFANSRMRAEALRLFQETAHGMKAPLWIGEWGHLFPPELLHDRRAEAYWGDACRDQMDQLDAAALGFARPWYEWEGFWATMYDPTHERRFLTRQIVRPYPQRVGGALGSFSFNPETRHFTLRLRAAAGQVTVVGLPPRHVAGGARVTAGSARLEITGRRARAETASEGVRLRWERALRRLTLVSERDDEIELSVSPTAR
jgi:hypothetical protein